MPQYDSGDWLVAVSGVIDFRTVTETLLDENGNAKTESVLIDPSLADTEANRANVVMKRLRGQYQVQTSIQLMCVTINAGGLLKTDVGDTKSIFTVHVGPNMVSTFTGSKKFMLVSERKVAEDHKLGIIVTQQEWVYYDRWRDCPASWKMIGPAQAAIE